MTSTIHYLARTLLVALISTAVFSISAKAASLPPLNEIVVNGNLDQLDDALQTNRWSQKELGGALIAAAGVNRPTFAELIIANGAPLDYAPLGFSPLIIAAAENSIATAKVLLDSGADPDFKSMFDWRPLHKAMTRDGSNDEVMRVLLDGGADPNAITTLQITPLHRAAGFCLISAVELLLQYGAVENLLDKYSQTAADRAEKSGCSSVAELLR